MIPLVLNAHDKSDVLYYTTFDDIQEPPGLLLNHLNAEEAMKIADSCIGKEPTIVNKKDLVSTSPVGRALSEMLNISSANARTSEHNSHTSMTGGKWMSTDLLGFNVDLCNAIMKGHASHAVVARVGIGITSQAMKSSEMQMNQDFAPWVIDFDQRVRIDQAHLIAALAASVMADVDKLVGKTGGTISLSCSSTLCCVELIDPILSTMELRPTLPTDMNKAKLNIRHTRPKLHIVSSSLVPRQCYSILNHELFNRLLLSTHPLAEQLRSDLMTAARENCKEPEDFDETEFVDMVLQYCGVDIVSGLRLEPNAKARRIKTKKASETDGKKEWLYEWTPTTYGLAGVYEYNDNVIAEKHIDNVKTIHPTWGSSATHDYRHSLSLSSPQMSVVHPGEFAELVATVPSVEQIEAMLVLKSEPLDTKKRKKKRTMSAIPKQSSAVYKNKGYIDSVPELRPLVEALSNWYTRDVLPQEISLSRTTSIFGNIRVDTSRTKKYPNNLLTAIVNVTACRYCPIKGGEHASQHQFIRVSIRWTKFSAEKEGWTGEAKLYCQDTECRSMCNNLKDKKGETHADRIAREALLEKYVPSFTLPEPAVFALMNFCGIPSNYVLPRQQMELHDHVKNSLFRSRDEKREAMLSLAMANVVALQERVAAHTTQ